MKNIINQYSSIEQMTNQYLNRTKTQKNAGSEVSFEDVLRQKQKPLKFSKHATQRLSQRNINLLQLFKYDTDIVSYSSLTQIQLIRYFLVV